MGVGAFAAHRRPPRSWCVDGEGWGRECEFEKRGPSRRTEGWWVSRRLSRDDRTRPAGE